MRVDEPLAAEAFRLLDNELSAADVNTFTALARSAEHVQTLDRATRGDRAASSRYTEIMAPLGLGDEMRAALVAGAHCWGVVCLHRGDGPGGFGDRELGLLRRLVPHLGEGLRRAVARDLGTQEGAKFPGAGVLVLSEDLEVLSLTPAAQAWIAEFVDEPWVRSTGLPVPVHTAVAALRSAGADTVPARVQVRTDSGRWLSVSADRLDGSAGPQVAVLFERWPQAS